MQLSTTIKDQIARNTWKGLAINPEGISSKIANVVMQDILFVIGNQVSHAKKRQRLLLLLLIHAGVLNISNKLLVSLDILLQMREHIKRGEPPGNTANAVILAKLDLLCAPTLTLGEIRYLVEKLYDGYFAFEVLTERDWNAGICGICGVCPIFESGDGNAKNCTALSAEMVS